MLTAERMIRWRPSFGRSSPRTRTTEIAIALTVFSSNASERSKRWEGPTRKRLQRRSGPAGSITERHARSRRASGGSGKKTAGIVLLFSLDKPYFPVDTHIRRVLSRIGLIEKGKDPHRVMNGVLPKDPDLMRGLHLHLIRLGRTVCRPRRPDCPACPLSSGCPVIPDKGERR